MAGPRISDHALLRYIERTRDIDVEALRGQLGDTLERGHVAAKTLGQSDYQIVLNGLVFLVRGTTLVTVLTEGSGHVHFRRLGKRRAGRD